MAFEWDVGEYLSGLHSVMYEGWSGASSPESCQKGIPPEESAGDESIVSHESWKIAPKLVSLNR